MSNIYVHICYYQRNNHELYLVSVLLTKCVVDRTWSAASYRPEQHFAAIMLATAYSLQTVKNTHVPSFVVSTVTFTTAAASTAT